MSNIQGKQAEFMVAAEQRLHSIKEILKLKHTPDQAILYMNLIQEELDECLEAFKQFDTADREDHKLASMADLLDGICDMAVCMMGLCNTLGLPFHDAYDEVHRANMTKFIRQEDGTYKILKRADGKVVKPTDWHPPRIIDTLKYKLINEG